MFSLGKLIKSFDGKSNWILLTVKGLRTIYSFDWNHGFSSKAIRDLTQPRVLSYWCNLNGIAEEKHLASFYSAIYD
jgi:hypothetical protein